ncbi:hypothetical protein QL285_031404 [Trifolium repens]|nr:hypothetical protein QL285_031404 [Trifolium repens]
MRPLSNNEISVQGNSKYRFKGHVFLHCHFTAAVWYMLSRWLGTMTVLPPNVLSSYVMFVGYGSNKKRRKGCSIVWLAFVWALWKCRNDYIFNNKVANAADLFDYIQRLSWKWFMSSVHYNIFGL